MAAFKQTVEWHEAVMLQENKLRICINLFEIVKSVSAFNKHSKLETG